MITKRDSNGRIALGSNKRHGLSKEPIYDCWVAMKARCNNPQHPMYGLYGGRGIKVCPEWVSSFDNFLRDMGPRPEGMTLDRIDNNRGYYPENCRWISHHRQQMNRRDNNKHVGVLYERDRNKYRATISVKGVKHFLGRFDTEYEAHRARQEAEALYAI